MVHIQDIIEKAKAMQEVERDSIVDSEACNAYYAGVIDGMVAAYQEMGIVVAYGARIEG